MEQAPEAPFSVTTNIFKDGNECNKLLCQCDRAIS